MADTAGDIFAQARWWAGDPNGDYTTAAYLTPPLNTVQDDLIAEILQNPNISRLRFAVVLPNVPAGTTSLRPWFDGTNEPSLALLKEITSLREKPTGAPDAQYQDMSKLNDLPVRTPVGYNSNYVFTGDDIQLPGATQALDIRVWGVFDPAKIIDGNTPVIPNCRVALVLGLAAAAAEGHGNDKKAERLNQKYEDQKFNLLNNIMLEMQFEETRQRAYGELSGTLE